MEKLKPSCKVISICSNRNERATLHYAINLAAAIRIVTKKKVMLLDMSRPYGGVVKMLKLAEDLSRGADVMPSNIGIDVLTLEGIRNERLQQIRNDYQYVVIYLPAEADGLVHEIMSYSDTVHFFVDSTEEELKHGYRFLKGLLDKGLKDAYERIKIVVNRLDIFDRFSVEEISWLIKRDVWALVPEGGILDVLVDSRGIPLVLRNQSLKYSRVVLRIAKSETDKLLGLALGSGAAFGLAHIGVLKVLEQKHIPIDIISGSSMGALIASMWGLGFSSAKIEHIAKKLRNKLNVMRLVDLTMPISGILAGKRLRRFLKNILEEKRFEDLQIPVKIVVYDLANRETLVVDKGPLDEAVYMSIAVPGIFKPKMERGRMIVDGGISDPVPVDILFSQGVKKIIAINVLPGPEDIRKRNMTLKKRVKEEENMLRASPFYIKLGILVRRYFKKIFTPNIFDVIMTSMQSMEYVLAENSCEKGDVVLRPVLQDASSVDFHLVKDFIKRGEEEASLHIDQIERLALR